MNVKLIISYLVSRLSSSEITTKSENGYCREKIWLDDFYVSVS